MNQLPRLKLYRNYALRPVEAPLEKGIRSSVSARAGAMLRRHANKLVWLFLGVWFLVNLATLTKYPQAEWDEGWYSSIAYNFTLKGAFGAPSAGDWYGAKDNVVPPGRLYLIGLGILFRVLGVGLYQARLFSWLGGVVAVVMIYRLGCRLFDRRTALGAALLLGVSWQFTFNSHYARMEMWMAAASVLVAYVVARFCIPASPWGCLASGVLAALLVDVHLVGLCFLAGISLFVLWEYGVSQRRFRVLAAYVLGVLMGLAYWALVHLLPDPPVAWQQLMVGYTSIQATPQSGTLVDMLSRQIDVWRGQYLDAMRGLGLIEGIYAVVGLSIAVWRRRWEDKFLLALVGGAALAYTFLVHNKHPYYRMAWDPFTMLLISAAISRIGATISAAWSGPKAVFVGVIFAPLVLIYLGSNLYLLWRFREYSYDAHVTTLERLSMPDARLIARLNWWHAWYNRDAYRAYR